ncbi:Hypothetical predicted protein [Mytilus galloprovincialis]|uniref:Uncharacterized protein n=1 Tax=Mytilus galloprovincialis TaxID=29158 RepID=A0A8B6EXX3_MYTGA|nr:Hypothetical predicted protein [Mytilus galloprovincialis]
MRWRNLYIMILWFATIALVLKILGYLLPWWFVARAAGSTTDRFFIGIVFGLDCASKVSVSNCTEYSMGNAPVEIESLVESASMLTLQIAMSVNLGLLFISCMIIVGSSVTKTYNQGLMVLAGILIAFSCVAYCVSLGFFIYIHINDIKKIETYEYNATNFPWSMLVTSVAALFLFATLILLVIALCRWRDDDEDSLVSYDERKIVDNYPAETRYMTYDNPNQKQYMMERPMVHSGNNRGYRYAVDSPRSQMQAITYPAETMYRPYSASRRY